METTFLAALSAGLIVTGWQAFKDSPWENFLPQRYVRSYLVVFLLALVSRFFPFWGENPGVLALAILGCERAIGDVYKGFFRPNMHPEFSELFKRFNLPWLFSRWNRFAAGVVVLLLILGGISTIFPVIIEFILSESPSLLFAGALIGLLGGFLSASGGATKDSQFEGFKPRKFVRSPFVAMFGGIALVSLSQNPLLLAWALIGAERVVVELYKTFWQRQVRGIFELEKVLYPQWMQRRLIFFLQYCVGVFLLTVLLFIY